MPTLSGYVAYKALKAPFSFCPKKELRLERNKNKKISVRRKKNDQIYFCLMLGKCEQLLIRLEARESSQLCARLRPDVQLWVNHIHSVSFSSLSFIDFWSDPAFISEMPNLCFLKDILMKNSSIDMLSAMLPFCFYIWVLAFIAWIGTAI